MDLYLLAVVILFFAAISDLVVGVSNDAVNFLNSALGSKVAPRWVIFIIASLGMLMGVTFSSGLMEVARKGIFHPEKFVMPELLVIFLAVMLTDVILLDLYNTFGLPTSTTVSVVFELLGAAVAVSMIKISQQGIPFAEIINYINTAKALAIISGILLSIIVAFFSGSIIQFITRIIFTFDFEKRLKRYGGLWGGIALSAITYFILIKGAKGASFITAETLAWIQEHTILILFSSFLFWAILLQVFLVFTRVNILKIIVLIGTGALAMAFAANDLVNFIGVPLAGLASYKIALTNPSEMLTMTMDALAKPVKSNTLFLLAAGTIMVVTLWISRKSRSVTRTELTLGRQMEGIERFDSTLLSRVIVRMALAASDGISKIIPKSWRRLINARLDSTIYDEQSGNPTSISKDAGQYFDLLRASVNLMVASALISIGTSLKLPLSTTYVTFMVSMGASLSDRAWGRESAVYRITGVLTVVGGWFFTAIMAFTVSSIFALLLYYFRLPAIIVLVLVASFFVYRTHKYHSVREREDGEKEKRIAHPQTASDLLSNVLDEMSKILIHLSNLYNQIFHALFKEDRKELKNLVKDTEKLNTKSMDMVSELFKTVLIPTVGDEDSVNPNLARTMGSIQELAQQLNELAEKCFKHVDNNHKGMTKDQIDELEKISKDVTDFLQKVSSAIVQKDRVSMEKILEEGNIISKHVKKFDKNQIKRIKRKESKTRISLLYFNMLSFSENIVEHSLKLLRGFSEASVEVLE